MHPRYLPTRLPPSAAGVVRALGIEVEVEVLATLARSGQSRTVSEIHERITAGGGDVAHRTTERSVVRLRNHGLLLASREPGPANVGARYRLDSEAIEHVGHQLFAYITTGVVT